MVCIRLLDGVGNTLTAVKGEREINLVVEREYREGDVIVVESSENPGFIWLQIDDALGKSLVYFTGKISYPVPFGEKREHLSPKAFRGDRHLLCVKAARDFEVNAYRNLAFNPNDYHENLTFFPHASANVETRGEMVFAASNVIDGVTANESHGKWPYGSWGINRNPDAELKLDFGRTVEIDRLRVYLRADFPHDNWWKKITVTFSDGESMELSMEKTKEAQEFGFEKKRIRWLTVSRLIPSEEPSPFPALRQLEVYGIG